MTFLVNNVCSYKLKIMTHSFSSSVKKVILLMVPNIAIGSCPRTKSPAEIALNNV